jgi:hypothetical protein
VETEGKREARVKIKSEYQQPEEPGWGGVGEGALERFNWSCGYRLGLTADIAARVLFQPYLE